jgi:HD superfamily phosphohydrolase
MDIISAVSRSTMYGAVYVHRTSRIAEGMISRALHFQEKSKQGTLQSIIGATDAALMESMKRGDKIGSVSKLLFVCF